MRIRLTELKRIIRSEVRRALHEEIPAGIVGDPPEPTPEEIAAAKKEVEEIIANASPAAAKEVADFLGAAKLGAADLGDAGLGESLSSSRVLRNKEHYYNRIIRKSLHEGAAGPFLGSIAAALIANNVLDGDSGTITAFIAGGSALGEWLEHVLGKFATNKKINVPDDKKPKY